MSYITLLIVVIIGVLGVNYFENCECDESRSIRELERLYNQLDEIFGELQSSQCLESNKLIYSDSILQFFEEFTEKIPTIESDIRHQGVFNKYNSCLYNTKLFFGFVVHSFDPETYCDEIELKKDLVYILEYTRKNFIQLNALLTRMKQLNNWLLDN